MKNLIQRILVINALMILGLTTVWGQIPSPVMRYKLDYDFCSNEYVAKVVPTVSLTDQIINASSQFTIVLPGNEVGNITTTNSGTATWSSGNFQVLFYPMAVPPATYRFWIPLGSLLINLPANVEYELFRFRYGSGTCLPGLRLYINGTDIFDGIFDFNNYFVLNNSSDDFYLDNVSNASPSCSQFDFGDLSALWASPKTTVISPDCNNDGIPDGVGGAVWAGNVVDAEPVQRFSTSTTLANGDNIDGRNDEDGLTAPSIPLTLGYSYDFGVRLNSNLTGKQVFYGLWFDWNSDGNFENDNATGNGPAFLSGSGTASSPVDLVARILTPSVAGSAAGQVMLTSYKTRLIVSDVAVTAGMFGGTFANGEIEDYQAPAIILPVTFGNVSAEAKNCNIYLAFDYLSQQGNKEFRIEYSINGTNWNELALLPNTGNTSTRSFSFVHTTPSAGVNYYRIKQVDVDGHFSYSKTVSSVSTCQGGIKIVSYPNPVHATLTVVLPINMGKAQLRVMDAAGRMVINNTTQASFNNINTQLLASGMYFLEVVNGDKIIYTSKFVKE